MAIFEEAVTAKSLIGPTEQWNEWLNTPALESGVPPRRNMYTVGTRIGSLAYQTGDNHQQPDIIADRFQAITEPPLTDREAASFLSGVQEGVGVTADGMRSYGGARG